MLRMSVKVVKVGDTISGEEGSSNRPVEPMRKLIGCVNARDGEHKYLHMSPRIVWKWASNWEEWFRSIPSELKTPFPSRDLNWEWDTGPAIYKDSALVGDGSQTFLERFKVWNKDTLDMSWFSREILWKKPYIPVYWNTRACELTIWSIPMVSLKMPDIYFSLIFLKDSPERMVHVISVFCQLIWCLSKRTHKDNHPRGHVITPWPLLGYFPGHEEEGPLH